MDHVLTGIHHLTAITAQARENHRFYTGVLGMRLVKKTVNQDDTSAYHLFYGDGAASPGSDVTFFDWPVGRERRGTHAIVGTGLRVGGEESLAWWRERLAEAGCTVGDIGERAGRPALAFEDPEGQRLHLVSDGGSGQAHPWPGSPVPAHHQIRGLGPITLSVPDLAPTQFILTEVLGMRPERVHPVDGTTLHVFAMGNGGPSAELHVLVEPGLGPAVQGAGGVHHVAFRTPDREGLTAWAERLRAFPPAEQRRGGALLFPLALFPRAERHSLRDRHGRSGLCGRRAARQSRREARPAALPRAAAGSDRGEAEAALGGRARQADCPAHGGWHRLDDGDG